MLSWNDEKEAKELVSFFSGMFEAAFKGNENLEKGLITGVYRIAKANLFSSLNNITEYNFLNPQIAPYYGISNDELNALFSHFGLASVQ